MFRTEWYKTWLNTFRIHTDTYNIFPLFQMYQWVLFREIFFQENLNYMAKPWIQAYSFNWISLTSLKNVWLCLSVMIMQHVHLWLYFIICLLLCAFYNSIDRQGNNEELPKHRKRKWIFCSVVSSVFIETIYKIQKSLNAMIESYIYNKVYWTQAKFFIVFFLF